MKFFKLNLRKKKVSWTPNPIYLLFSMDSKHFPKNWLFSNFYWPNRSNFIFSEVKHRRKIRKNHLPVILEPNIRKKMSIVFGIVTKCFIMYLKETILRTFFLSFFDGFRYAGATIVALCSQGLR